MRKISFVSRLAAMTALAVAVALGSGSSAQAALDQELWISVDGSAFTIYQDVNGGQASTPHPNGLTLNGVLIKADVTSNSTGAPSGSFILGSTLQLQVQDSSTHDIVIRVGDTNYSAPTTPPAIIAASSLGGTVNAAGTPVGSDKNTISLQSFVDPANGQNTTVGFSPGLQSTLGSGDFNTSSQSFNLLAAQTTITSLAAPYSLTSNVMVHLVAGANVNFTSQLNLTPVPEPSTMAIAGLGALGLIGYGIRRRRGA